MNLSGSCRISATPWRPSETALAVIQTLHSVARPRDPRLFVYAAVGLFAGVLYVAFDSAAEARLATGTLIGHFAQLHRLIDRSFPILAGGLLGLCLYQLRLSARLAAAEEAASRAEALRVRLQKVERDQAVWVVVAAVLHELNNPLHALGLLLDELSSEAEPSRQTELAARARAQARRALGRLEALRALKSLGEPEAERISLDRTVATLAEEMTALAGPDGVRLHVESAGPLEISADPTYLRTILENLLDNSRQALTGHGGAVTIELATEAGRAVVRVSDDGAPIDPQIQSTLFDPLRTTKTHGLGLGLPIARALARAMRGELTLDARGRKVFRLELPLASR
jgi:signal transduction histidine kinase